MEKDEIKAFQLYKDATEKGFEDYYKALIYDNGK